MRARVLSALSRVFEWCVICTCAINPQFYSHTRNQGYACVSLGKKFETYAALDVLAIAAHEDTARVQLRDLLGRMRLAAEKTVAQSELDLSDVVLVDLEDFRRQRALSVAEALVQFAKPVGDAFDEVKDAKTANCELCRVESGKRAESEDREREGRKFVSLTWV